MPSNGDHEMGKPHSNNSKKQKNSYFTILVLDSDFTTDKALEDFLKTEGYAVITAASAREALAKTYRFEPDLILLDCELKGFKCMSLLPDLMLEHLDAAVILLGSRPSASNMVAAIELGAMDYFERPLDLKRLKLVIDRQKELLDLKPKLAE